MGTAVKFAGYHIAPMVILTVAGSRRAQQAPVAGVPFYHVFAEGIQFVQPIQVLQAIPGLQKVASDQIRIVGYFKA